jgi:hypothetical protein
VWNGSFDNTGSYFFKTSTRRATDERDAGVEWPYRLIIKYSVTEYLTDCLEKGLNEYEVYFFSQYITLVPSTSLFEN